MLGWLDFQYGPIAAIMLLNFDFNTVYKSIRVVQEQFEDTQQVRGVLMGMICDFIWLINGLLSDGIGGTEWLTITHYISVKYLTIYSRSLPKMNYSIYVIGNHELAARRRQHFDWVQVVSRIYSLSQNVWYTSFLDSW